MMCSVEPLCSSGEQAEMCRREDNIQKDREYIKEFLKDTVINIR